MTERSDARSVLALLRDYATYDPLTGHFIRRRTTSSNAKAGDVCGSIGGKGYRYLRIGGRQFRANRLAWLWMTGDWPPGLVDHENGNRTDDHWENLRLASNGQNCANAKLRKDNTLGLKGVRKIRGRFQVRIGAGGKVHVGTFDTAEEARDAYLSAASNHYGIFARAK